MLGIVDFSHLHEWIKTTDPTTALTAVVRVVGMVLAVWLMTTTAVYLMRRSPGPSEWSAVPGGSLCPSSVAWSTT